MKAASNPALAVYVRAEAQLALGEMKCIADFDAVIAQPCNTLPASDARPIVLFGDSHAAQWFKPLEALAGRHQIPLITVTKFSCAGAPIAKVYSTHLRREYLECERWRADAMQKIIAARPAVVFVANFSVSYAQGRPYEWGEATSKLLRQLTDAGARVVLIRDTPAAGFAVPACLARAQSAPQWLRPSCNLSKTKSLDDDAWQLEKAVAQSMPGVTLLDLTSEFCDATSCPAIRQGEVIYNDGNHITDRYALSLVPRFAPFFATPFRTGRRDQ